MKKALLYLTFTIVTQLVYSQNFDWVNQMGGSTEDKGNSITTDANGNVFSTGFFTGTVDFDPGISTMNLSATGGYADTYIQKIDPSGNLLWVKQITGPSYEVGNSITTDVNGNVYVTGYFSGTADFDPGTSTLNLSAIGLVDAFIIKLDANGNLVWAKQIGGASSDVKATAITAESNGFIYVAGSFTATANFDTGGGISNLTSTGGTDIFIQKLDVNANFIWVKQIGGSAEDKVNAITTDVNGNILSTGFFSGTADFDPGTATSNATATGFGDIFILKIDANGNFQWAKQMGAAANDFGNALVTDASGNVYTTGFFIGTVDFDPGTNIENLISVGGTDVFIQKLSSNGSFIWVKQMGGTSDETGNSITIDVGGNIYTAGIFNAFVDFDPGIDTVYLNSVGNWDIFIQKIDASGHLKWVKQMGGSNQEKATSITVDLSGQLYTTGYFYGTVDFDPSGNTSNLVSAGNTDIFIQKLFCENSVTETINACGSYTWIDGTTYHSSNNTAVHILSNNEGCDSTITLNLTLIDLPISTISRNGTNLTADLSGASYQWIDCDNNNSPIAGEINQTFTVISNGNYAVIVNDGSCSDTSDCILVMDLGVLNQQNSSVILFPNPTSNAVNIESQLKIKSLSILDIEGKVLLNNKMNLNSTLTITLSQFDGGIYFIKIIDVNDIVSVHKLIKQ